ncbi:MAG: hypothetical protein ACXV3A_04440 [Kineosporiaceae bacterium]
MRSPTGARRRAVRWFGEPADSSRVLSADHLIEVPLDHDAPGGERIEVFARELRAPDLAETEQPYLLFLQGGPGSAEVLDRLERTLAEVAPDAVAPVPATVAEGAA